MHCVLQLLRCMLPAQKAANHKVVLTLLRLRRQHSGWLAGGLLRPLKGSYHLIAYCCQQLSRVLNCCICRYWAAAERLGAPKAADEGAEGPQGLRAVFADVINIMQQVCVQQACLFVWGV